MSAARRYRLSAGHVLWAWDVHIWDWHDEGLSVPQIRRLLRDDYSLSVGEEAIRAVLAAARPRR